MYLPSELQRSLGAAAKREGRSQAEIMREAIAAYLSGAPPIPLRSIGAGSDHEVTGATSEDWLRKNWSQPRKKSKSRQ